ncbi:MULTISPECIES: YtxH domain-containing protein [Sutcliffiella]|uniref:YtxH domain-containing protein n=1 Tax=Sutcliffiella cohnii TaxID=33932 RepID=A0A223KKJ5_9BACI|nr:MULTISPECIES: YtxH domain-containing protein [Sutcliffiella]AST90010.1 hypothetical protein BC6307_01280 [Sutcliffiella cohnii]MED4018368.1 YtxH domain-containing protein [Sutcliffiella cohnii]WBL15638.1 YtxH domain-containing protein [Sutcliffiella sp. NC1]
MSNRNKLLEGMLIGAVVGAAISLLDRETRETVIHNSKRYGQKMKYVIQHPDEVTQSVRDKFHNIKEAVEDVSDDLEYLKGKMDELKETTPKIVEIVKDTSEVISKRVDKMDK